MSETPERRVAHGVAQELAMELARLVSADRTDVLELVQKHAERVLGQPCLTRWSDDGMAIEVIPVIRTVLVCGSVQ